MSVSQNIQQIKKQLPLNCTLVAVSKTKPIELILEAYNAGHRDFGENYVQELVSKHTTLPADIRWHFIGHLQTNKVKYIIPFVYLIHGVDSKKLLVEINKQAGKINRIVNVLLQVYIAKEETKFGLNEQEVSDIINEYLQKKYVNIQIVGFMGMASNTNNVEQIKKEFGYLAKLFNGYKEQINNFTILSIGMSNDYLLAIEAGSNMVRIGSAIFGERNKKA
jgi:hypothetical protein